MGKSKRLVYAREQHYRFLTVVLLSCIYAHAHAQTPIQGKVIDAQSGDGLAFCTIELHGENAQRSISNEQGYFTITPVAATDSVYFSHIGYGKRGYTTQQVANGEAKLTVSPIEIDDVVVSTIDFAPIRYKIMQGALKKYPARHPNLRGTYRKQTLENGRYVYLGECNLEAYFPKMYSMRSAVSIKNAVASTAETTWINDAFDHSPTFLLTIYPWFRCLALRGEMVEDTRWTLKNISTSEDGASQVLIFDYETYRGAKRSEYGTVYYDKDNEVLLRIDQWHLAIDSLAHFKNAKVVDGFVHVLRKYSKQPDSRDYALAYSREDWTLRVERYGKVNEYKVVTDFVVHGYPKRKKIKRDLVTNNPLHPDQPYTKVAEGTLMVIPPDYGRVE